MMTMMLMRSITLAVEQQHRDSMYGAAQNLRACYSSVGIHFVTVSMEFPMCGSMQIFDCCERPIIRQTNWPSDHTGHASGFSQPTNWDKNCFQIKAEKSYSRRICEMKSSFRYICAI